jgi:hypothetical protein
MKKIFGLKKNKEPPPSIQDATNQVIPRPLPSSSFTIGSLLLNPQNPMLLCSV